jgi:lysophospholipase L1-like esterase
LVTRAPARPHPVVCIGSSSFTIWFTLDADLGHIGALNHGFGGAELSDCNHYWDRLVVPYSPRLVVLAAGDNDLANGKSPATVIADFEHAVSRTPPGAKLLFLAVKPSVARWPLFGAQTIVNDHVAARAAQDRQVGFIDIRPAMLAADGRPIPGLFLEDGLHLSVAGYAAWTSVLRPRLHAELSTPGS